MQEIKVRLTFTEEILGTAAADKEIHKTYIASLAPNAPSKKEERMITMYILSTPVDFLGKAGVWKQMDYQIIRTASQLDLLNCLVDMWRALQEWQ